MSHLSSNCIFLPRRQSSHYKERHNLPLVFDCMPPPIVSAEVRPDFSFPCSKIETQQNDVSLSDVFPTPNKRSHERWFTKISQSIVSCDATVPRECNNFKECLLLGSPRKKLKMFPGFPTGITRGLVRFFSIFRSLNWLIYAFCTFKPPLFSLLGFVKKQRTFSPAIFNHSFPPSLQRCNFYCCAISHVTSLPCTHPRLL